MTVLPAARNRFSVDLDALASNYRALARLASPASCAQATCGAAVKAECYGLGLDAPASRLWQEGCRDFFVATLHEAARLRALLPHAAIHVLNGVLPDEVETFRALGVLPVLNTAAQVALWRQAGQGAPANLMIDTGMNRLGVRPEDVAALDLSGLALDIALTHLAAADEPGHPLTRAQADLFAALAAAVPARRRSLANSAGIVEIPGDLHDLARPGIALYGGIVHPKLEGVIRPVVRIEAQVIQAKTVPAGETVGYNATWQASRDCRIATLAIGYADGYLRGFSNRAEVEIHGVRCPVVGRVSMDLATVDISAVPAVQPGDWATLIGGGISLPEASRWSGLSQYELLTVSGRRYDRQYRAETSAVRATQAPQHEASVSL